ncbi:NlpC/P60 family protein [Saccharopolyspora sp. CA-218241]|uniref:NlpC/P60 family protein n=1 Tax=Saccharopolyspora sp. CA-218241 TaxID=3240027 RepID=UPI003D964D7A
MGPQRALATIALVAAVGAALPATGASAPPNPSDAEIEAGRARAERTAGEAGRLTHQLAAAETRLMDLRARVALAMEDANKARVDLQRAERAHRDARYAATSAAREATAAAAEVDRQRGRLDEIAAGSYRQGSRLGSVTAFFGSRSPAEVLERATLLDLVSRDQLDVLDDLERARIERVNKDSLAREAVQRAEAAAAVAERSRAAAVAAERAAIDARNGQVERARQVRADKSAVESRLAAVRGRVSGMEQQRDRYREWAAAQAAPAPAAPPSTTESSGSSAPSSSAVEVVVQRALSQVGVPYAWGGGNAGGPTRGIRDGGVADAHGDYRKTGFDCSGLMIYAFAGVGIELAHYSGYQYRSGEQVPLSRMQRGDMLFWQTGGRIHHVALYLGGGKMVEAPYSGSHVRVAPVRYGGIAPYAVRLL